MEWDALMKALDENGDGTIEYKELFDAIWEDKREYSRGVGAKPTVKQRRTAPLATKNDVVSPDDPLRSTSVRRSSHGSTACRSITHRFEGDQIIQRGPKGGAWTDFCL